MAENINEEFKEKTEEFKAKAEAKNEEFKEKTEEFRARAEARTEANKERWDETYSRSKDVAEKVGENLSKTIDDTIIAMKGLQKNFDNRYQEYKESAGTNKITVDLAETKDAYYIQAYLAGIPKEEIAIEATDSSITIKTELYNILKNIEAESEDAVNLIITGTKAGNAERTINLGDEIIKEEIKAKQENGLLFISIPKKDIPKTKIDIE